MDEARDALQTLLGLQPAALKELVDEIPTGADDLLRLSDDLSDAALKRKEKEEAKQQQQQQQQQQQEGEEEVAASTAEVRTEVGT